MTKTPAFYFELHASRERKLLLTLPSGKRAMFYRGRPDRNPIMDERDVRHLRKHPSFFEVVPIAGGKGKDAPSRWVPAAEAERYVARRAQRKVSMSTKQSGGPATTGGGTPPPLNRDPMPKNLDERIAEIIVSLDPGNPEHFTQGGKPSVGVIELLLGQNITAEDRDRVWEFLTASDGATESAGE